MAITLIAPAVLAAAAAAAIAFAPAAAADDLDDLAGPTRGQETAQDVKGPSPKVPSSRVQSQQGWNDAPKGWTNEAQWARPGASNPFGSLPKPPIFAMD